ncbi:hypothetical protein BpHYR1_003119 [Brachionus plicatilis]|uniref:Uncharacterized protein n=1 Tax=Brachionus plicatilis TaxID=10195 RepID=A0A3M7SUP5_BRAPC|nr:hypothetical protein BpHYR1_003119 [Brachionus plicatilis]
MICNPESWIVLDHFRPWTFYLPSITFYESFILVLEKSKSWAQSELRFPWNQIVWKEKLSIKK